jgi:hypothetical protein
MVRQHLLLFRLPLLSAFTHSPFVHFVLFGFVWFSSFRFVLVLVFLFGFLRFYYSLFVAAFRALASFRYFSSHLTCWRHHPPVNQFLFSEKLSRTFSCVSPLLNES